MTQPTTPKPHDKKKKLIQLIHIAKSQLRFDDDTYRDMLNYKTGKNSTKEMTLSQLNAVLAEFEKKGFVRTLPKSAKRQPNTQRPSDPQSRLIRHLWLTLHNLGAVNDGSDTAIDTYATNQMGASLSSLEVPEKSQLIESLKKWIERVQKANPNQP